MSKSTFLPRTPLVAASVLAINQQHQQRQLTSLDCYNQINIVIHGRSFNKLCSGNAVLFSKPLISRY